MRRLLWWNPWRLVLLLILAAIISLAAALYVVDRVGESIIDAQASAAARAEQSFMVTLAREEGLPALVSALDRRERLRGGVGFRYAMTSAKGHLIAGAPAFAGIAHHAPGWRVIALSEHGKKKTWHVLVGVLPTGQSLYIAQGAEQRSAFRRAIVQASGIALFFASFACTLAGLLLSGYLLRRAGEISRTAEQIAGGNLNARIGVTPGGDVFDRLGAALNTMLSRIEELMTGMRTITDSLAHDLRRPLSHVEYALDRAATPGITEAERTEAIEQAQHYTEETLATFTALLDVARAESGLSVESMADVDIEALLVEVAELFEPMFEDAGQVFILGPLEKCEPLRSHDLLLRQAVGNLLHNAASHAGAGATITLTMKPDEGGVDIIVADTGAGIPEAERGRVQQRFVRLDPARSMPGSGLGLAIAAACAKLHGGTLELSDNAPGLRATLKLRQRMN